MDDGSAAFAVMRAAGGVVAVRVEAFGDTEEVVVRPLDRTLDGVVPCTGSAVLGEGSVALLLDGSALARVYPGGYGDLGRRRPRQRGRQERRRRRPVRSARCARGRPHGVQRRADAGLVSHHRDERAVEVDDVPGPDRVQCVETDLDDPDHVGERDAQPASAAGVDRQHELLRAACGGEVFVPVAVDSVDSVVRVLPRRRSPPERAGQRGPVQSGGRRPIAEHRRPAARDHRVERAVQRAHDHLLGVAERLGAHRDDTAGGPDHGERRAAVRRRRRAGQLDDRDGAAAPAQGGSLRGAAEQLRALGLVDLDEVDDLVDGQRVPTRRRPPP